MFSFERMRAWKKAIEWADGVFDVADRLPQKLQFSFGEQLRRACLSVPSNLAEGSGRRTPRGQRYFYDIAQGSTCEVISILAILNRRNQLSSEEFAKFYQEGDDLSSMIYGLKRATFNTEEKQKGASQSVREDAAEYGGSFDEVEPPE